MSPTLLLLLALGLGLAAWLAARARAWSFRRSEPGVRLASLPNYHSWDVALWVLVPAGLFALIWSAAMPQLVLQSVLADPAAAALPPFGMQRAALLSEARAVAVGAAPGVFNPAARALIEPFRQAIERYELIGLAIVLVIAFAGGAWAFLRVKPDFAARSRVERAVMATLVLASLVAILTTLGIFISLVFETARFFGMVSPVDFLFGTHWAPDPMARAEAVDPTRYGALPLFWGTIYIGAIIAMIVAIPLGLMSAIYLTQYATPGWRKWLKPSLEILAGVPTVVYGYFAALTVAPMVRDIAQSLGVA
jgi:phosphate transport system permease protein